MLPSTQICRPLMRHRRSVRGRKVPPLRPVGCMRGLARASAPRNPSLREPFRKAEASRGCPDTPDHENRQANPDIAQLGKAWHERQGEAKDQHDQAQPNQFVATDRVRLVPDRWRGQGGRHPNPVPSVRRNAAPGQGPAEDKAGQPDQGKREMRSGNRDPL
jgi:hypothetical protein